jgi:hypothetical protein
MKPAFKLSSSETGTEYWIYIHAPNPKKEPGPWPVMVFLDGDNQFADGIAGYKKVRAKKTVPPLLLVGVGYGASYGQPTNRRGRDYTPTHHAFEPTSGGAKAFLQFLRGTLWRELKRRYSVHPKSRGIGGHSLGSLLVLYALFQEKPFFSHHLASGPSIWWDDRAILGQAKRLRARQAKLRSQLYLGVGGKDSESMLGDLGLLEAQLAKKPFAGLRITSECFPDRTHYTTEKDTFPAGLTTLFS